MAYKMCVMHVFFLQLVILPVRNHRYIITKNHLLCLKLTITCTSSRSFTWFFPACEHLLLLGIVRQIADELKELQSNEARLNAAQHTEKIAGSLYNDFFGYIFHFIFNLYVQNIPFLNLRDSLILNTKTCYRYNYFISVQNQWLIHTISTHNLITCFTE